MQRTTPNRQQIEAKARELYVRDQIRNGCSELASINPEYQELLESGYVMLAQNLLMRETDSYKQHLVSELRENPKDFNETPQDFDFRLTEALKSGVFIAGGKQCGKTNLAKVLARQYLEHGCIVKVFDISQQWLDSSVPNYIEVKRNTSIDIPLYQSVVFDLSRLYPSEVKAFVNQILSTEFEFQVATPKPNRKWIVYVLEECQILVPQNQLRRKEAQEVLRLMSSGANYNLSYVAITQRPSTVDTTATELAFQKYFARCDGENDLDKIRHYIGEYADQLEGLKIGEFIYDLGNTTKKISVPLFSTTKKPRSLETQSIQPQQQKSEDFSVISFVILALTFLGLTWILHMLFG